MGSVTGRSGDSLVGRAFQRSDIARNGDVLGSQSAEHKKVLSPVGAVTAEEAEPTVSACPTNRLLLLM